MWTATSWESCFVVKVILFSYGWINGMMKMMMMMMMAKAWMSG